MAKVMASDGVSASSTTSAQGAIYWVEAPRIIANSVFAEYPIDAHEQ